MTNREIQEPPQDLKAKWTTRDLTVDLQHPPQTVIHHESPGIKPSWSNRDLFDPDKPDLTQVNTPVIL